MKTNAVDILDDAYVGNLASLVELIESGVYL